MTSQAICPATPKDTSVGHRILKPEAGRSKLDHKVYGRIYAAGNIMEGYPDGTFGPNRPITRAETVATVNRVLADMTVGNIEVLPSDMTEAHWAYNDVVFAMNHRILKDVAADESQFIKSEEYDKNKITETEVVEDTSDENAGAGASPTPEPSPTPNA